MPGPKWNGVQRFAVSQIVFRRPSSGATTFVWAGAPPSRWILLLTWGPAAVLSLLVAALLWLSGVEPYRARGAPVPWGTTTQLFLTVVAACVLLGAVSDRFLRMLLLLGDRHTSVWLDDDGVVLWYGVIGVRTPYERITRVRRLDPGSAPAPLGLLLDREAIAGVRIDSGPRLLPRPLFLLVAEPDRLLEELKARAAARGVAIDHALA